MIATNAVVCATLWWATKNRFYKRLFGVWLGVVAGMVVNGLVAERGTLATFAGFATSLLSAIPMISLLADLGGVRFRALPYLSAMALALGIAVAWSMSQMDGRLGYAPIPLVMSTLASLTSIRVLMMPSGTTPTAVRVYAFMLLLMGLHAVDFIFLFNQPEFLIYGFLISAALQCGAGMCALAAVGENFATENSRLRFIAEYETSLTHSARMRSLGEIAAGVAHEINNPLMIVSSTLDYLILDDGTGLQPVKHKTNIERARKHIDRISRITHGLLAFSRQTPEGEPPQNVELATIITSVFNLCGERAKKEGTDFFAEIEPGLTVRGRPNELTLALFQLVSNALDATRGLTPERWIRIQAKKIISRPTQVNFSITDSGVGIPGEIAKKLGKPFFTTKDPSKHVGLGYSTALGLIEKNSGQLSHNPDSPHTQFTIIFQQGRGI